MILFDGVNMESVAKVKIEDVRVSSVQFSPLARSRATSPGSVLVRNRAASRTVTVTFALLVQDRPSRQAALMALNAWAKTDADGTGKPQEYKFEDGDHPGHYLMCACTAHPDPSLRQWWESKLRFVFTCFDNPFWTDKIEKSVACGTAFRVLGDAEPLMRIERSLSGAASNQSYGLDDKTMTFSTIPAGALSIDLNAQTASVSGVSIMQYYVIGSRFLTPRTGTQTVTGTGTVKYRERWA